MSTRVTGTKTIPVDADALIIRDSAEANPSLELKEITFANLGVSAVLLTATNTATNTRTYTMYSDVAATNVIGTFPVIDGADGTGTSLPEWNAGVSYDVGQQIITSDGLIYISSQNSNTGNVPATGGTAFWDRSPATQYPTFEVLATYPTMSIVYFGQDLWIAPTGAAAGAFASGYGANEWRRYVPGQVPWRGDTGYAEGAEVWHSDKLYRANGTIVPNIVFVTGYAGATWLELVPETVLTFMSLAPGNINVNVTTTYDTGSRQQYGFETSGVPSYQIRVDPFNMVQAHASSTYDDQIVFQSSGYYRIDMGYMAQVVSVLQESILYVNASLRDRLADVGNASGIIPWSDARRVLHFDQPAEGAGGVTRKPIAKGVIRHFVRGDVLTWEEDGAAANSCHSLNLQIQQLDQRALPL